MSDQLKAENLEPLPRFAAHRATSILDSIILFRVVIVKMNNAIKPLFFQGYLGILGSLFCFSARIYEKKPTQSGLAFRLL